ncbi:unnamed protein product [Caenorhabditis angaria]|uniref:Serpentine receptor class gamma n=1 Tax=Caenorhabditis angaria TaxID=860376 RepID=A0A9P1IUM1_9PELO|nr:unnamed protein product [Caenorhabditis angaria]
MDTFKPAFIVTLIYGLFSVVLYTLIVFIIIRNKNKNLNSSFFTIFVIGYFINLTCFFNSYVTLRLPQNTCKDCKLSFLFSTGKESTFPLGIFYAISINMAFIQSSMTLLISINRYTTFLMVLDKDKIWNHKIIPCVTLIIILWPLYVTYPVIFNPTYYMYYESITGYRTKTEAELTKMLEILNIFMITVAVLSAIFNTLSWRGLRQMQNVIKKSEKALIYTTFIAFAIQVIAIVDTLIIQKVSSTGPNANILSIAQFFQTYVSDLLTFNQPYVIIFCSSVVRKELRELFLNRIDPILVVNTLKSQGNTATLA